MKTAETRSRPKSLFEEVSMRTEGCNRHHRLARWCAMSRGNVPSDLNRPTIDADCDIADGFCVEGLNGLSRAPCEYIGSGCIRDGLC